MIDGSGFVSSNLGDGLPLNERQRCMRHEKAVILNHCPLCYQRLLVLRRRLMTIELGRYAPNYMALVVLFSY